MAPTALATDLTCALDPARFMQACGLAPDPWQRDALRSTDARLLWLCSRQSGKSTVAACLALHRALYAPGALVLLLSPSLRQSQELFKKVQDACRGLDNPAPLLAESALRLELANGSRIISLPGTEGTVRGYSGVDLLIIDEAARVVDDLYYAVTPMLAVSQGRLIALSTPAGRRGWFYDCWQTGGSAWSRTKITASACPRIPASFLAQERASVPWLYYASEYECEFSELINAVFRDEDIEAMFAVGVRPRYPEGI